MVQIALEWSKIVPKTSKRQKCRRKKSRRKRFFNNKIFVSPKVIFTNKLCQNIVHKYICSHIFYVLQKKTVFTKRNFSKKNVYRKFFSPKHYLNQKKFTKYFFWLIQRLKDFQRSTQVAKDLVPVLIVYDLNFFFIVSICKLLEIECFPVCRTFFMNA